MERKNLFSNVIDLLTKSTLAAISFIFFNTSAVFEICSLGMTCLKIHLLFIFNDIT